MELNAKPRTSQEKLAEGMIPAVAYQKGQNVSFAINRKEFDRAFRKQSTTGLFDITVEGGETFPALVKTVQMDKRKRTPIHVDFYMVTYGQAIEVNVPVHTKGKSAGEKEGGLLDIVTHTLHIQAPGPRRIPAELVVDVSRLRIGDHVTAADVKLPEGCELKADPEQIVISVLPPRMTEEQLEAEAEAAKVAGLVAAGELTEEAAAAILEGETTIEEAKEAVDDEVVSGPEKAAGEGNEE